MQSNILSNIMAFKILLLQFSLNFSSLPCLCFKINMFLSCIVGSIYAYVDISYFVIFSKFTVFSHIKCKLFVSIHMNRPNFSNSSLFGQFLFLFQIFLYFSFYVSLMPILQSILAKKPLFSLQHYQLCRKLMLQIVAKL